MSNSQLYSLSFNLKSYIGRYPKIVCNHGDNYELIVIKEFVSVLTRPNNANPFLDFINVTQHKVSYFCRQVSQCSETKLCM